MRMSFLCGFCKISSFCADLQGFQCLFYFINLRAEYFVSTRIRFLSFEILRLGGGLCSGCACVERFHTAASAAIICLASCLPFLFFSLIYMQSESAVWTSNFKTTVMFCFVSQDFDFLAS